MSSSLSLKQWLLGVGLVLVMAAPSAQARSAHAFQCPHAREGAVSASLTAADTEILKSDERVLKVQQTASGQASA
jgi:hypothetical protein